MCDAFTSSLEWTEHTVALRQKRHFDAEAPPEHRTDADTTLKGIEAKKLDICGKKRCVRFGVSSSSNSQKAAEFQLAGDRFSSTPTWSCKPVVHVWRSFCTLAAYSRRTKERVEIIQGAWCLHCAVEGFGNSTNFGQSNANQPNLQQKCQERTGDGVGLKEGGWS